MSWLMPVYLLGALAVGVPLVLHLLNPIPAARQPFSTLQFLSSSPPTLSKRRDLRHWLLLLLRMLAIGLFAAMFARPFFRSEEPQSPLANIKRMTALFVDTSASAGRADVWPEILRLARARIESSDDDEIVGVFAFHDQIVPLAELDELVELPPLTRRSRAIEQLNRLRAQPRGTNLGMAFRFGAELFEQSRYAELIPQVCVVTDRANGSDLTALAGFEWPASVEARLLSPETVIGLARLQLLPANSTRPDESVRVRILNSETATETMFQVGWEGTDGQDASLNQGDESLVGPRGSEVASSDVPARVMAVDVPAGQSRTVSLPLRRSPGIGAIVRLKSNGGSICDEVFVGSMERPAATVLFYPEIAEFAEPTSATKASFPDGPSGASGPSGLASRFYLQQAMGSIAEAAVTVQIVGPFASEEIGDRANIPPPRIALATGEISGDLPAETAKLLGSGGLLVLAPQSLEAATAWASALELSAPVVELPSQSGGWKWQGLQFDHPLLKPFADARFDDFSGIRFWKGRGPSEWPSHARVLARFEGGHPALVELPYGGGTVIWMASGWHPSESQLARSPKFPMLCEQFLRMAGPVALPSAEVETAVASKTPQDFVAVNRFVLPEGTVVVANAPEVSTDAAAISEVEPGLYRLSGPKSRSGYSNAAVWRGVNLPAAEALTDVMTRERIEQAGVPLDLEQTAVQRQSAALNRQRSFDEAAESTQRLWQWILCALAVLVLGEILLANRLQTRRVPTVSIPSSKGAA